MAFGAAVPLTTSLKHAKVGVPYIQPIEFRNTDSANSCLNHRWLLLPPEIPPDNMLGFSCDLGYITDPGKPRPPYPATVDFGFDGWVPTRSGVFPLRILITNNLKTYSATFDFTLTVDPGDPPPPAPLRITAAPSATASYGVSYTSLVRAEGGTGNNRTWKVSAGSLPPGLALTLPDVYIPPPGGQIHGCPSAAGQYTFSVTVAESAPAAADTKTFSIAVQNGPGFGIQTVALPHGSEGMVYPDFQLTATPGCLKSAALSLTWSAAAGTLPDGMALTPSGILRETPKKRGIYAVKVTATDAKSGDATAQLAVTIDPPPGPMTISLVDPVPLGYGTSLLMGSHVSTDPTVTANPAGRLVHAISADGFSQLVVKIPTEKPGQTVLVEILDEGGAKATLSKWYGGLALPRDLSNASSPLEKVKQSVQAVSAAVNNQAFAFAVYVAPPDFDRATPEQARERSITVRVTSQAGDGTTYENKSVQIVRPPVLLVHGLNSEPSAWDQVDLVLSSDYWTFRADYSQPVTVASTVPSNAGSTVKGSSLGLHYNAPLVLTQLKSYLQAFRAGKSPLAIPVAAVQMDVVAHSMGGLVTRMMTYEKDYYAPETLNGGFVHKLITVGTPHLGSPFAAEMVKSTNWCPRLLNNIFAGDYFVTYAITPSGQTIDGAMQDLHEVEPGNFTGNPALQTIHTERTGVPPLRTAMIAGVMTPQQLAGLGLDSPLSVATLIKGYCVGSSLAHFLTPATFPGLMGPESDGLVTRTSAFDGLPRTELFPAVHSEYTALLGFGRPDLIEPSSQVPKRIDELLRVPASSPLYVSLPHQ
jgi:pimeloyl-ACP methyl ester carboxylesterase